jgi:hypothetical protein
VPFASQARGRHFFAAGLVVPSIPQREQIHCLDTTSGKRVSSTIVGGSVPDQTRQRGNSINRAKEDLPADRMLAKCHLSRLVERRLGHFLRSRLFEPGRRATATAKEVKAATVKGHDEGFTHLEPGVLIYPPRLQWMPRKG